VFSFFFLFQFFFSMSNFLFRKASFTPLNFRRGQAAT